MTGLFLWLLSKLTNGRPMERLIYCFRDVVAHKPVYLWEDFYGRQWLASTRWGWFRVKPNHGPEIWRKS